MLVKKIIAIILAVVSVLNLVLFAMGKIGMGMFWIILAVVFLLIQFVIKK